MPSIPRAVIFDWDNTLADNWGTITDAMNAARSLFGMDLWTEREVRARCVRALRDSFPEWFGEEWQRARDAFYDCFNKNHLERVRMMEGADSLLRFLHAHSIPLFIVSNKKNEALRKEVEALGWENLFVAVVGSLDAERDKPSRDPVDMALSRGGLMADDPDIWFVGDKDGDVECARASGCTPVFVHDVEEGEALDIDLNFSDCAALLRALQARFEVEAAASTATAKVGG